LRHSCNLLPHCRSPIKPLFFPPPSSLQNTIAVTFIISIPSTASIGSLFDADGGNKALRCFVAFRHSGLARSLPPFPPRKLTLCHLQSNPQPVSPPSPPHPRFRCAAQSTKDNGQGSRRRATTRRVVSPPRNRPSKPIPRDLPSVSRATDRWSFANQTSLSNPPRGSTRSPPPPDSLSLLPPRLAAPSPHTPLCRVPLYAIVLPNQSHATSHRYPAPIYRSVILSPCVSVSVSVSAHPTVTSPMLP